LHSYQNDQQFQEVSMQLATRAATEVRRIRTVITSFASVAAALRGSPLGWGTLHQSVALALVGDIAEARSGFASLHSATSWPSQESLLARVARELDAIVTDKNLFSARIGEIIHERRRILRLSEIVWPVNGTA
jgi:hypothetical protein